MYRPVRIAAQVFAAMVALVVGANSSIASIYSFKSFNPDSVVDAAAAEAQLTVHVIAGPGANKVTFNFLNAGPAAMSICDVYFDDSSLLEMESITNGPGVSFRAGASPGNLPGGNNIDFNTTKDLFANSEPEVQPNGVNRGETLGITFTLIGGQNFADAIAALKLGLANPGEDVDGGLRIGIHVQGFAGGRSVSLVNGPPGGGASNLLSSMPEPATLAAWSIGLALAGWAGRRRWASRK